MSFKKKPSKSLKATLNDLLQSGAVKTGKQILKDQEAKAKYAEEFDKAVEDELYSRKIKGKQ